MLFIFGILVISIIITKVILGIFKCNCGNELLILGSKKKCNKCGAVWLQEDGYLRQESKSVDAETSDIYKDLKKLNKWVDKKLSEV